MKADVLMNIVHRLQKAKVALFSAPAHLLPVSKQKKLRFDWKVFESKGNELTLFPSITRSVMAFIARDTNPIISFAVGRFSLIELIIVDILHR